ncbi:anti-anti-sigma factor [Geodermatophilus africanus]|uniref:Anti-anti-sigma factor n=1 Tax=Geodermatophilus africanus TaxID=1137993 RepID=A0A1H3AQJ7_9ACTN|nr:MEDS domain-containing protein [Geodermatophilus africanus]SDX31972.1 anti-anti-sigma factor [Geodermatophilus africanus]
MTAPRRLDAPTGLQSGDHACWTFADAADLSAAVLPFLDEGRRLGEQLLLIGASRPELLRVLAPLPGRDELLADGQLQVHGTDAVYGSGDRFSPEDQVAAYRTLVAEARQRGRTGLRVAADVTPRARHGAGARRQLHVYEHLADAMMGAAPMTALCLYDAALGDDVLGPVTLLHPDQHSGSEALAHLSGRGLSLSLHGEVDVTLADDLLRALVDVACDAPGEVVLDLSALRFLDVAGARALARATRLLRGADVHLRLVGAPRTAARCLALFGLGGGDVVPE